MRGWWSGGPAYAGPYADAYPAPNREQQLAGLKEQAEHLERALKDIHERIAEMDTADAES